MPFEINIRFSRKRVHTKRLRKGSINRMNVVLSQDTEDQPLELLRKFARAYKKITMERRKTRNAKVKSRKKPEGSQQFLELQPNFEVKTDSVEIANPVVSVEPLIVGKTTTLPVSAADRDIPIHWYQCGRCGLVFDSVKMMESHRETHRQRRRDRQQGDGQLEGRLKDAADKPANMSNNVFPVTILPRIEGVTMDKNLNQSKDSSDSPTSGDSSSSGSTTMTEQNKSSGQNLSPETLNENMLKRNGTAAELQCSSCNKSFSSRRDLKLHMSRHNEAEKSIHLGNPGKKGKYDGYSSLEEESTPYDDCDLPDFSKPSAFVCTFCRKQFGQENSLKRHLKSHLTHDSSPTRKGNAGAGDSRSSSNKAYLSTPTTRLMSTSTRSGLASKRLPTEKINLDSYSPISP